MSEELGDVGGWGKGMSMILRVNQSVNQNMR